MTEAYSFVDGDFNSQGRSLAKNLM